MTHSIYRGSDQNMILRPLPKHSAREFNYVGDNQTIHLWKPLTNFGLSSHNSFYASTHLATQERLSTLVFTPPVSNTITLHFTTQYILETSYKLGSALTIAFMPVYTWQPKRGSAHLLLLP